MKLSALTSEWILCFTWKQDGLGLNPISALVFTEGLLVDTSFSGREGRRWCLWILPPVPSYLILEGLSTLWSQGDHRKEGEWAQIPCPTLPLVGASTQSKALPCAQGTMGLHPQSYPFLSMQSSFFLCNPKLYCVYSLYSRSFVVELTTPRRTI